MTSEKGDLAMLAIPELESRAVYNDIIGYALQFTFIKSIFIDSAQFVNQQMGSFYNSIPDKQFPHKCFYKVLLQANIFSCKQEENATVLQQLQSRLEGSFPGQRMPRLRARQGDLLLQLFLFLWYVPL